MTPSHFVYIRGAVSKEARMHPFVILMGSLEVSLILHKSERLPIEFQGVCIKTHYYSVLYMNICS